MVVKQFLMHLSWAVCLLINSTTAAQELVSVDDFAFLSGYWVGEGMGGVAEEMWMPPTNGRMFGIYKHIVDGELVFSEFMEIASTEGQLVLRLKHFNPDFSGWEESTGHVTFPLESVEAGKASFQGLIYELVEENQLRITLRLREADGTINTEVFNLRRQVL